MTATLPNLQTSDDPSIRGTDLKSVLPFPPSFEQEAEAQLLARVRAGDSRRGIRHLVGPALAAHLEAIEAVLPS